MGSTQHGLGIMGNSAFNVVKEKAGFDELAMLLKEVGKIKYCHWVISCHAPSKGILVLLHSFLVCYFEKVFEDNSLLLQKIEELAMHLESFQIEVEVLRKQQGQWKEKDMLQTYCMFQELLYETIGQEELEMVQVQWANVLASVSPEDLICPTQASSAFPIFVQHMPANDAIPAYNKLT